MRGNLNHTLNTWTSVLVILFLLCGVAAIAFTDFMGDRIYGSKRIFFVILLVSYAAYRIWRLKKHVEERKE
jgi:hypothetical protein